MNGHALFETIQTCKTHGVQNWEASGMRWAQLLKALRQGSTCGLLLRPCGVGPRKADLMRQGRLPRIRRRHLHNTRLCVAPKPSSWHIALMQVSIL